MGTRVQAPANEGVGYHFPERTSDCSGDRPGWYPFQIAVCDVDEEAPDPLPTERHRVIPDWPYDD